MMFIPLSDCLNRSPTMQSYNNRFSLTISKPPFFTDRCDPSVRPFIAVSFIYM